MDPIKKNDSGAAVEDVQHRLVKAGYLAEDQVTGTFGAETENAVLSLCRDCGIEPRAEVDNAVWTKLVDASFELGDRNLFLRVPFFHGADVRTLQEALSALGFSCGIADGIFGVHTEDALRRFQLNMGLPTDGIAGAFTFRALLHLQHSWKGKDSFSPVPPFGLCPRGSGARIESYLPFRHIGIHPFGCCSYVELGACHYSCIEGYQCRFVAGCSR